ncbi:bifunctional ornithine acetyltransferase/N-acetylglutamate synthase [Bacillaceae bacterium]
MGFRIVAGDIAAPRGFSAGGTYCGLKQSGLDLGVVYSDVPAAAAAVYTKNVFQAAPLKVTQQSLAVDGKLQAVIVNSGNANACTGRQGEADALAMREETAAMLGVPPHYVAVASTGVIGRLLDMEKVKNGIRALRGKIDKTGGEAFAQAILTTDTVKKTVCLQVEIDGKTVTIGGAAKGSGMIHPNMATMLAFLTTDANVEGEALAGALKAAADETFNMISVDGDTSTNDMAIALANGLAGNEPLSPAHPQWERFYAAFRYAMEELAKMIARDGEGATKLIEVHVKGAPAAETARGIARTVVASNLVKAAVFGADANWGRIVCAAGYSGQEFDPERVEVFIGDVALVQNGLPLPFAEEKVTEYLKRETVQIAIDLHAGAAEAKAWGCDLTYDYVRINAMYRT